MQKGKINVTTENIFPIIKKFLYSDHEIFLRELVSNASDALDKLRFESTRGTDIADPDLPLEIKIEADDKAKQITISDTGIGMTEEEIVSNLGTIAKSGTEAFLQMMSENGKNKKDDKK